MLLYSSNKIWNPKINSKIIQINYSNYFELIPKSFAVDQILVNYSTLKSLSHNWGSQVSSQSESMKSKIQN